MTEHRTGKTRSGQLNSSDGSYAIVQVQVRRRLTGAVLMAMCWLVSQRSSAETEAQYVLATRGMVALTPLVSTVMAIPTRYMLVLRRT